MTVCPHKRTGLNICAFHFALFLFLTLHYSFHLASIPRPCSSRPGMTRTPAIHPALLQTLTNLPASCQHFQQLAKSSPRSSTGHSSLP
ncbi:hypothetical protein E2C01_069832 [Portunus trituberculatus]|uniref:Uncharacterized protein n=1 Tax=Portunus trituberculatus TaxID=210409 RepID=A0A5B7HZZ8_PORTR|nr:hypothetical protein [Portunus trituberculatus]